MCSIFGPSNTPKSEYYDIIPWNKRGERKWWLMEKLGWQVGATKEEYENNNIWWIESITGGDCSDEIVSFKHETDYLSYKYRWDVNITRQDWIKITVLWTNRKNTIVCSKEDYLHCVEWCQRKLGQRMLQGTDGVWYYAGNGDFEFMNEQDAVLFSLRWA
jgi:hypothetical protein